MKLTETGYSTACYGTELNFKYNVYHVASADVKALESDERIFAVVVLAARRMLDADGDPEKRGQYSLELLNLLRGRGYDTGRVRSLQKFVYRILRIKDKKIDPKVREEWNMQLIPIDEAVREIYILDAKEEGMEEKAFEVAKNLLTNGVSLDIIVKSTGLDEEDILSLESTLK